MIRFLTRLLRSHEIGEAVALAKYYHRLGMQCASYSTHSDDAWRAAARRHWAVRDARMWKARELAGIPLHTVKKRILPALQR